MPSPSGAESGAGARPRPRAPLRALLVDGDAASAGRLVAALETHGLAVEHARSPLEAIRACRERDIALVLLRIPLPGIDAVAACAALREGPAPPALILLDAAGQAAALERALPQPLRPDATLSGACDAAELVAQIRRLADPDGSDVEADARSECDFAELLVDLHARRETGVLEVRAEDIRTDVTFWRGDPVFVEGGGLRQTLGRLLLRRGEIREEDYARVVERMTERLIRNETVRMGEVLVELELLTPAEVHEALTRQVREKIVACFQWRRPAAIFRPLDALPDGLTPFRAAPIEALVLDGLRTHYDAERLQPLLQPDADRFAVLQGDPREIASRFQTSPAEQKLLLGVSGQKTLAALRQETTLEPLHASQLLAALRLTGHLQLERAPARPRSGAPAARNRSDRTPVPTAPARGRRPPAPGQATRAADRARRSLDALRRQASARPAASTPTGPAARRLEAEGAFRKGQRLLAQNLLPAALRELRRAAELDPEQLEFRLLESWVGYLCARDEETRMLAKAKARAVARKLLAQDRDAARAHSVLGRFLHEEGEVEAAERHFRLALRADPGDVEAQRGLRLIQGRRRR